MCGIAGVFSYSFNKIEEIHHYLKVMNQLISHRGPDDSGVWVSSSRNVGFSHRRLSIIDLSNHAHQPMQSDCGYVVVFNGEIYNHIELRNMLKSDWNFKTQSDTEVILAAYHVYGVDCVKLFKGMFAFALWDGQNLFCARDHFGIKPLYFTRQNNQFIFASESKALLPFVSKISTNRMAFVEYVTFQYPIGSQTLFEEIFQLEPAHAILINAHGEKKWRYWDVHYQMDYDHTPKYFHEKLDALLHESIQLHLRADVNVGAYVSGGVDSSLIGLLACQEKNYAIPFYHGRFLESSAYDESSYAESVAIQANTSLNILDIHENDFIANINKIMYFMDFPVAGPGVFPQYMVSEMAAKSVKVVLGGQGGDELFGGYARYLIAYFEQCIKASIEGTYKKSQNFVVTPESIIPNLELLKSYQPMLKQFWKQCLFDSLDKRYYQLINRGIDLAGEVQFSPSELEHCYSSFLNIFNFAKFEKAESYFDSMTHFDFKCLLPGLLHVEDRVSMAHGLESRVPFLYWPLVEFLATIPANIKFSEGRMKFLLKNTYKDLIPNAVLERKDKMGFPVPLTEWMKGSLKEFIMDIFNSGRMRENNFFNYDLMMHSNESQNNFSRKMWGGLCYELWQQQFHDKQSEYRSMLKRTKNVEIKECEV